jgi:hypothetical protein
MAVVYAPAINLSLVPGHFNLSINTTSIQTRASVLPKSTLAPIQALAPICGDVGEMTPPCAVM